MNYSVTLYLSYAIPSKAREGIPSLPLDRPRRLRRNIVDHAVDALDLVDDPGRDAAQEVVGERVIVGSHAVGRGNGAERADMVVGAVIAHHADGADREQNREGLPDRIIEARIADLLEIDGIRLAEDVATFPGDFARNADGEARALPKGTVVNAPSPIAPARTVVIV